MNTPLKNIAFLIAFLFINITTIFAQNTEKNQSKVLEKIYLHTDRNFYNIGESLWYKAYSLNAQTNKPHKHSRILHVELISPDKKIISKRKTYLDSGMGNGDFILTDSLGVKKPGTYQLRAYTKWMRNFGDHFIFTKNIEIISINDKNKAIVEANKKKNKPSKKIEKEVEIKDFIDLQFFPEGGSLVENVYSIVAFKATKNGSPLKIEGLIKNSNGESIASLKTEHDGMGRFKIQPKLTENYTAEITINNEIKEFKLPEIYKTGYTLGVKKVQNKIVGVINTNEKTLSTKPSTKFKILIKTRGIVYFEGLVESNKYSTPFLIPSNVLPEGIAQVTIFDEEGKPYGERLVYIEKQKNHSITLKANKTGYEPKEKVTLTVNAKDKNDKRLFSNFSLAAVDQTSNGTNSDNFENICSYFLMQADIKGNVNNAGYYFNPSNKKRLIHLDLLLQTQGWRDFLWKKELKTTERKFDIELGINVTGRVKKLFGNGPKPNSKVLMYYIDKEKTAMNVSEADKNGRFAFENLVIFGETTIMLSAKDKGNKSKGEIVLDSLEIAPPAIKFDITKINSEEKTATETVKENIFKKFIDFDVPIANQLDEVLVVGKAKKAKDANEFISFNQTFVADGTNTDFNSVQDLIQFSIPNIQVVNDTISFSRHRGRPALIVLNDIEIDASEVSSIVPESIDRIEAISDGSMSNFTNGVNGVILIYTKKGVEATRERKKFHTSKDVILGIYNWRAFYSPNYEEKKEKAWDEFADIRNTLYWNPYVIPNEEGVYTMSYFNSEVPTKVGVTLEGITADGIPICIKTNYTIEK
ncbi:hypothetical protein SAMN05444411_101863 [Lutibacter oricola]|uniref:Alpha-2-macroglobulin bait region domain-containing protein n=1 Tax=Lutibacter oricola TaxID=762486 RepID=A0A1H2U1I6_9FLAO|nr:hypothetical protein [Lutibacter oricola]SDW49931.1 hypothetical protein SAMN05444411_101863 [Lutibacter oricola]